MSEENYFTLRDFLNESLLMDLVLFLLLFMLIASQEWSNILLAVFPMITFGFSLFFQIIGTNKWRTQYKNSPIIYNPLGAERKNANRLGYSAIIQLILVFWLGAESLYHPQLIDNYYFFFNLIFSFSYTFGFYWIFIDLWKNSNISILIEEADMMSIDGDFKSIKKNVKGILSSLKLGKFKQISLGSLIIFLILNLVNLIFALLIFLGSNLGISYVLPGTGIESSGPVILPCTIFVIIIISPLSAIIFLILSYKDINDLKIEKVNEILASLPENIRVSIEKNLLLLSKKFRKEMKFQ